MSLRTSSALAAMAVLAACGAESPEPGGISMDCAIEGAAELKPVCTVTEVKAMDEDAYLVLWHPDGGFRRVRYRDADASVEVLDGAELATGVVRGEDGSVEFAIDRDRYRLPARMTKRNLDPQPAPS